MPHTYHPTEYQKKLIDDLKQIHGIGPAMEQRLNRAGIFTFAQIANLSTKELASLFLDVPGLSAERIAKIGWINQAQLMMEKEDGIDKPMPEDNSQHSALFSVDLLIDNQNHVRRTHILHVQSLKEDPWAGWNQDQLVNFILENAIVRSSQIRTETTERKPVLKIPRENAKKVDAIEIQGDLYISEVEIQPKPGKVTHWLVPVNETFALGLILDMSKTSISPGIPLQYQTEIYVKNLTDGKRQNIGEDKGIIESKNLFPLMVKCNALPQGSYRLEACVILSPDMEDPNPRSRLMAMTEGKVFRVS